MVPSSPLCACLLLARLLSHTDTTTSPHAPAVLLRSSTEDRKDYKCPQCERCFGASGHLREHIREKHGTCSLSCACFLLPFLFCVPCLLTLLFVHRLLTAEAGKKRKR